MSALRMNPLLCYNYNIPATHTKMHLYRSSVCVQVSHSQQRRSANYKPTIWHDHFIQSINTDILKENKMRRAGELVEEVKQMICAEEGLQDKLELVDVLEQIGVAYHFKDEIKFVLNEIYDSLDVLMASVDDNIYMTSLLFRLLRHHGFCVSQDIFQKYMENNGDFKAGLRFDTKGMLSLYEASYLARGKEGILEKARHFTKMHLKDFLTCTVDRNETLQKCVAYTMELPLHWRMRRLHTRWFIDEYKTDQKLRPALLELAVLDYNLVQSTYKKELKEVSRWWTGLGLYEKLPFIRDRLVENHLWSVGWIFEPKHSSIRKATTQANSLIATIDDIYDVYGSLDELEIFTDIVERWDVAATDKLPDYMKICFVALFDTVEEQGREVMKEKGLDITPNIKKAWTDLCKAYLVEAKWYHKKYTPTLEEYLENAWITFSSHIASTYAFCMNQEATSKDLENFLSAYPDKVRLMSTICRLCDDLATSKAEIERGDVAKSIQCYMHERGVTELMAREKIKEMIWQYWELLNSEYTWNSSFEEYYANFALDVTRMAQCIYQYGDGYGEQDRETKDRVISVLFEPIQM
ncbi:hypothetical protein LUZ60_012103 [Juncus effusus]|nr:hypothetical protein LUZ60_012103 [Juncus effusus]